MKIQKKELGDFVLDSTKSYSMALVSGVLYLWLYSNPIIVDGDAEDKSPTYELDAYSYTCSGIESQEIIQSRLQNGEFDRFVGIAIEQESFQKALGQKRKTLRRLEQTDYRETKFVCSLIQAFAEGQSLEDLQRLAQKFITEYPGHLETKKQLREGNRAASDIVQRGLEPLPF